jgi:D-xylose transport system permease protein
MTSRSSIFRSFGLREAGVYYALLLLVLVLAAITAATGRPPYLSAINLTNIVYQSSLIAIMGVAMTVVLITGNFDLSVASVAALAAAVLIMAASHIGFWPAFALALLVSAMVGAINGVIVQFVGINAFIVTLGTLTAVRGLVLVLTDGRALSVDDPATLAAMGAFEIGRVAVFWPLLVIGVVSIGVGIRRALRHGIAWPMLVGGAIAVGLAIAGRALRVPNPVVYMLAFTALCWAVLRFTTLGRRLYAVGGNAEAARLAGIRVHAYKLAAFVLSSLAAGFAGVLFASRLGAVNPTALQGAELTVIAAAILGGTSLFGGAGSVVKTVAGALLLFTLTNGFNVLDLGANYQGLIEGSVLIVAAAIYTVGGVRRARPRKATEPSA